MKILVAFKNTKESKIALEVAREHARYFNGKLFVVFSSEGGKGEDPEEISKVMGELKAIGTELTAEGIPSETTQLARGLSPGEDIVQFADENDVDLIYVGIRKKSRTSKLLLGSTAQYIILKAKCPVVSVK